MTPRMVVLLATVIAVLTASAGLYWKGRRDAAAELRPHLEAAARLAAVAGLETEGARDSAGRAETAVRRRSAAGRVVADLIPQALKSEDADAPLDPDRAARLRAADRELCIAAPELIGCAADRHPG
ncbi:hypothetical protein [Phenylobacterium sp.]|uniref:hypothetical protein n=1 Tax=Phenylobacterium sp. TaxID=1871053 RepID=UPI00398335B2